MVNIYKKPTVTRLLGRGLVSINYPVIFTGVNFNTNYGLSGAAIYSQNSPLTITGSTFISNIATDSGGAIYFDASTADLTSVFSISGNTFTSNQARVGGN